MAARDTVLVVGAGPTGLTLAAALARRGIACRVIDRRAGRGTTSRALGIQARTMEVFARLGIADRVRAAALPLTGHAFHLKGGTVRSPFRQVHPDYPAMAILPQARTEAILEAAAPQVEWNHAFVGTASDRVALVANPAGQVEAVECAWIAGCDGAHSAVRGALGASFPGKTYPARLYLADCRVDGLEPGLFHVFLERPMIAFAQPGGLWRVVAVLPEGAPPPAHGDMGLFGRPGIAVRDPVWWSGFRIDQRAASRLRNGRLLLAGDAAHIHSPAGGQGMNIGIQDAWWLAEALAAGEAAVDLWCARRRAVAQQVLKATDRATRTMISGPAFLAPLRDLAVRLAARSAWIGRRMEADLAGLRYPPVGANAPGP